MVFDSRLWPLWMLIWFKRHIYCQVLATVLILKYCHETVEKIIELTPTEQLQNSLRCTKDRDIKVNSKRKRNGTKTKVEVVEVSWNLTLRKYSVAYTKNHINIKFHLRQIPSMCLRKLTRNAVDRCTCF